MFNKQPGGAEKQKPKTADKKTISRYKQEEETPSFFDGNEGVLEKERREKEEKIQKELEKFYKEQ